MKDMTPITELFGANVFNETVMIERLPRKVYNVLKKTMEAGEELDKTVAEVVANAMKDWAIEHGATHYSHWFQPMTGITAEKHDSFIHPLSNGKAIMEFSGKELIKGEPDASSFPSGGLRQTFEARGYSVWDCTSPAFLREDAAGVTLCIPTAFCSYTGEALDKKTPLLRSMEALSKQGLRICRVFGDMQATRVIPSVGPEQEYFIVDKKLHDQRTDLRFTGRTLFGAMPPKGQEMDDHYFGSIKERIGAYMHDLNLELWKLGVSAKTQHNEAAPAQHELAPIYSTSNIATDHNQMVMDTMKKIALRHGLVCLLHEKPFEGVNGSGKHNNWSLCTDTGKNLLEPGKKPHENMQFLVMITAMIKAVDEHAALLRFSAANAGNDHRLGANEAPPAIISVFLGEQLDDVFAQIEASHLESSKNGGHMRIGVSSLPYIKKDATDRNRTSPFAFTGNKFEFRMVPSSGSIADANTVINTIMADALCKFAQELEEADDLSSAVKKLITREIIAHKRIIFNGNGYAKEWVEEAERRGLPNLTNMVDAVSAMNDEKTIAMFEKFGVLTAPECHSRAEIAYEGYSKTINIESRTMIDMAYKQIIPAVITYTTQLSQNIASVKAISASLDTSLQERLLDKACMYLGEVNVALEKLVRATNDCMPLEGYAQAAAFRDHVCTAMAELRAPVDELEKIVGEDVWPFPTYGDLMYRV